MIGCKWNWHNTGHQVWYDDSTFETLQSTYPLQFYDDFLGSAGGSVFDDTMIWGILDVSAVGTVTTAIAADSSNGLVREKIRPHLAAKYFNGKKNDRTGDDSGNNDADKGS